MKTSIKTSLRELLQHRAIMTVLIFLVLLTIAFILSVMFTVSPSELKVVSHYSAFGITHFYREPWLYMFGFALFGLIACLMHIGLTVKLIVLEKVSLATLTAWGGIVVTLLAWIYFLRIAEFS